MKPDEKIILEDIHQAHRPPPLACANEKGHVSVNPFYGCRIGCPFCINQADAWHRGKGAPRRLASAGQLLRALEEHAAILAPFKLSVLDFCDPFDPPNLPELREILDGMNEKLPGRSVLLTTRLHPGEAMLDWLAGLRNIRLSVFVSLGDATGGVRPVTPVDRRLELLEDSSGRGLHTVMLLRPLVREWMREEPLARLLARARRACHEVVAGGLSLSPAIVHGLRRAGWPVPSGRDRRGELSPGARSLLLQAAGRSLGDVPLSEHRSCAVNRRLSLPCQVAVVDAPAEGGSSTGGSVEVKACKCFADAPAGGSPVRIRACRCFADLQAAGGGSSRQRDAAGYCLLRRAA